MKRRNVILIIGFILLFFIIDAWTGKIDSIQSKFYNDMGTLVINTQPIYSEMKNNNIKFGLWTAFIVVGIGCFLYINKNTTTKQSEIDTLKAKIAELENKNKGQV